MAELPDEAVSVGSSLKKAKKAIQDVLDTENYDLSLAVSGSISTFSKLMKSKRLISVDVTRTVQSGQFEAIMHDYKAAIKLKQDVKSLEKHCSLLLEILDELGGPATDAANVLRNKLKLKIKEVTGILFLSDSSEMLPSFPPPRGNRSNSDGLIQSSIKHLSNSEQSQSNIEQSQSDIERSQSDGHLECKRKALGILKLSSVTEEPSSAAATSGNLDQHFSDIGGAGSPSRPSTLTACTQEVANQTNVDSGISFTASIAADDHIHTPPPPQADTTITSPGAPDNYNIQTPISTTDSENTASSGMHIVPASNHVHSSTVSGNEKATITNTANGIGKKTEPDGSMQPTQASMDDEQATSYNEIVSSSHNANIRPAACLPQLKTVEAHSTSSSCNHVEQICEKDRQIKVLEKECRKLEEELETIKCEKDELVKVERAFKSKIEQITRDGNKKIQEIEERLEEKNEKLQEAKEKLLEAKKEICEIKKEKEEELQDVKQDFKEVKCELKEVKAELKGELKESKKELKEMKKEKNEELQEIKKELEDKENQLREAKRELKAAKRDLENKDDQLEELRRQLKKVRHQQPKDKENE